MIIDVLGLGESLSEYKESKNITIGVNNICQFINTDYVICVDKPSRFDYNKLCYITKGKQKHFLTHIEEWKNHIKSAEIIELSDKGRGILTDLDSEKYCYSITSPFVAVHHAYKIGAKEIIMYGVDLNNHKIITGNKVNKTLEHFRSLNIALNKKGVNLYVSSRFSALSSVIPVYHP